MVQGVAGGIFERLHTFDLGAQGLAKRLAIRLQPAFDGGGGGLGINWRPKSLEGEAKRARQEQPIFSGFHNLI
jgi:hypothetical protein